MHITAVLNTVLIISQRGRNTSHPFVAYYLQLHCRHKQKRNKNNNKNCHDYSILLTNIWGSFVGGGFFCFVLFFPSRFYSAVLLFVLTFLCFLACLTYFVLRLYFSTFSASMSFLYLFLSPLVSCYCNLVHSTLPNITILYRGSSYFSSALP